MYSEKCKKCVVDGCHEDCSVRQEYMKNREKVIHCKDCKHKTGYLGGSVCDRFLGDVWIVDDDFCSYAEKR